MEFLFGSLRPLFTGEIFDTQSLNLGAYLRCTPETDHYLNAKKSQYIKCLSLAPRLTKNLIFSIDSTKPCLLQFLMSSTDTI